MGNASIIPSSALWLALVACYDAPPDVQLHVTRPTSMWNLKTGVCHEGTAGLEDCDCAGYLWDTNDKSSLTRRQALYVNDGSKAVYVVIEIHDGANSPQRSCYRVELTNTMLVRRVDLDAAVVWTCDSGTCEDVLPCTMLIPACGL
jgi:hypothetical protein